MSVQIICPNLKCRKILAVPDALRGKSVKCQYCQMVLRVPGEPKIDSPAPVKAAK
jgi:hypothetical protein